MSLKQYSPHLQLTIHKPKQFIQGLRLFSLWIIGLLLFAELNLLSLFCTCIAILFLHVATERSLVLPESSFTLSEFVFSWGEEDYELQELRLLFGYFVILTFYKARPPLYLSRDRFSRLDWQCLVRYCKLR